jgi:hypothetical protein
MNAQEKSNLSVLFVLLLLAIVIVTCYAELRLDPSGRTIASALLEAQEAEDLVVDNPRVAKELANLLTHPLFLINKITGT